MLDYQQRWNVPSVQGVHPCLLPATPYDTEIRFWLQMFYLLALAFWIYLVWNYKMLEYDLISIILILIPPIIYFLTFWTLSSMTVETEEKNIAVSYLSVGMIVIAPLITWAHEKFGEHSRDLQLLILALILAIVSLVDMWVAPKYVTLVRHVRSILQIAALVLISFSLYHLFLK